MGMVVRYLFGNAALGLILLLLAAGLVALVPQMSTAQSSQVREAQAELNARGYNAGPADGLTGPRTSAAIRAFQEANGLEGTGKLDEPTTRLLFLEEAERPDTATQAETGSSQDATEPEPRNASIEVEPLADIQAPRPSDPELEREISGAADAPETATISEANPAARQADNESDTKHLLIGLVLLGLMALGAFLVLRFVARVVFRLTTPRGRARSDANDFHATRIASAPTISAQSGSSSTATVGSAIQASIPNTRSAEQQVAERKRSVASAPTGWIPKSGNARIAGHNIGGMVYVGRAPRSDQRARTDNAFIDPSKSVARVGNDYDGQGMSYWPSYASIESRSRATYLEWLKNGRCDPRYDVGYVFLYFYGLERRVFVDRTDANERAEIATEVKRLLDVYGASHSVQRYLGAFLEAASILDDPPEEPAPVFDSVGYDVPANVLLAIGKMAARGEALTADWLLSWYMCHPEAYLRTPAKRAFPEFRAYFQHVFDRRFPEGMKLRVPKRRLRLQYHAASGNFVADLAERHGEVPDVSGFSKPLATARELSEEATEALDKYSRYLGRNPDGRGTIEAHALLPEEISQEFPCAVMDDLRQWVAERISEGSLVQVEDLIARLEGARPDKIGKRQLTGAADALAKLGIGLAPDPRFALRRPKFGEPVVLFELPAGTSSVEAPSPAYQVALLNLAVGTMVAHADGRIDAQEEAHLRQQFEANAELPLSERARLSANLIWMRAVPPDLGLLRAKLKGAPAELQDALGQLAVIAAGADGRIDSEEVKLIERLYKTMGLDVSQVYSDLHALSANGEPVTVRPATAGPSGYAIPPAPQDRSAFKLDAARLSAVQQDTARVANVLGDVFSDDDSDIDDDPQDAASETGDDTFTGLDGQHRPMVAVLVTRESWSEEEFASLAEEHQLMPSGALETINEWAFDRFEDALIEAYDGLELNGEIARQLLR